MAGKSKAFEVENLVTKCATKKQAKAPRQSSRSSKMRLFESANQVYFSNIGNRHSIWQPLGEMCLGTFPD